MKTPTKFLVLKKLFLQLENAQEQDISPLESISVCYTVCENVYLCLSHKSTTGKATWRSLFAAWRKGNAWQQGGRGFIAHTRHLKGRQQHRWVTLPQFCCWRRCITQPSTHWYLLRMMGGLHEAETRASSAAGLDLLRERADKLKHLAASPS